MRRIRFTCGDPLTAPRVPFPDQHRIATERVRGRECLGPDVPPQAIRTAKGRHATGGGNTSSSEDGQSRRVPYAPHERIRKQPGSLAVRWNPRQSSGLAVIDAIEEKFEGAMRL